MHPYNQPYGGDRYMQQYMPVQQTNTSSNQNHNPQVANPQHYGMMQNSEAYYYNNLPNQQHPYMSHVHPNIPINQANSMNMMHQLPPQHQHHNAAFNNNKTLVNYPVNNSSNNINAENHPYNLIKGLLDPATRKACVMGLQEYRDNPPTIMPLLWHSYGAVTSLMSEIFSLYPLMYSSKLDDETGVYICHILTLLQSIASHEQTRIPFIKSYIPIFIFPIISIFGEQKALSSMRLACLGVIGALVKNDDPMVIDYLITTDVVPICLKVLDLKSYNDVNKTVAIFILSKILNDKKGFDFIIGIPERYKSTAESLLSLSFYLKTNPSLRLYKHLIRIYLKLCENPYARQLLQVNYPEVINDNCFSIYYEQDQATKLLVTELVQKLSEK